MPQSSMHENSSTITPLDLSRYPNHADIERLLHAWAAEVPDLVQMESLGRSTEGRELWSATVTDHRVGFAADKPAVYLEGNIHAGEVLPSVVCLYTIHDLISRARHDGEIADLLRRRTFYIRPRVSPDGAECYLTGADRVRSASIPWPNRERQPGLHPADVNGDGHVTLMRIRDDIGEWRRSARDSRVMVRCQVDDPPGERYRLCHEGTVEGPIGPDFSPAPTFWGLDFNRSFPHNWQPEYKQAGAGPYPLYPPETRATADFFIAHKNIGAAILYHTAGGFVFHLPSSQSLDSYAHDDLTGNYKSLSEVFCRVTGQPAFPSYEEATNTARCGSLMDWAYSQQGVLTWVPELWDIQAASGARPERTAAFQMLTEDEELTMLAWADEHLEPNAFIPWSEFTHPQLGPVEIGGWTFKFTHQNCPPRFIQQIARPVIDWSYVVANALPELAIESVSVESLGEDHWLVRASVVNRGFLPTNVSQQAVATRRVGPVTVSLSGDGVSSLSGTLVHEIDHLHGSSSARDLPWRGPVVPQRRTSVEWLISSTTGADIVVTAASDRAGHATETRTLGEKE